MQIPQPLLHFQDQSTFLSNPSTVSHSNSIQSSWNRENKEVIPISKKQIDDISSKIKQQVASNRKCYQKLIALNPYFSIKLLLPINAHFPDDYHSDTLRKMMKQFDLLLDQGSFLEKQLKKAELRRMQSDYLDPTDRDQIKNHYTYLRKIWLDFGKKDCNNTVDKLDQLNKRVVIIKNSIFNVAEHQKKCYKFQQNYQNVEQKIKQFVYSTEEYTKLVDKFNILGLKLEQTEGKLHRICNLYEDKLLEKDMLYKSAKKEAEDQRKTNKQLKQKLLNSQQKQIKLLQKISQLQILIKKNEKSISNSKQNNNNESAGKVFKEQGYINQIKFKKMQFDLNIRKNYLELREFRQIATEKTIKQEINQPYSQSQRIIEIAANGKTEIENTPVPQEIIDQNIIRNSKSIDNKKGRFTRMRSPANGKLIKPYIEENIAKLEYHSPRMKQFRDEDKLTVATASTCKG